MNHGIVDVFAFQEALLIEAAFAIVILVMAWAGFRRWLQHKERMGRLIAEETAELAAQYGASMEQVEARLKAVEQMLTDGSVPAAARVETMEKKPLPEPNRTADEA